jgi:hypothetical protein
MIIYYVIIFYGITIFLGAIVASIEGAALSRYHFFYPYPNPKDKLYSLGEWLDSSGNRISVVFIVWPLLIILIPVLSFEIAQEKKRKLYVRAYQIVEDERVPFKVALKIAKVKIKESSKKF